MTARSVFAYPVRLTENCFIKLCSFSLDLCSSKLFDNRCFVQVHSEVQIDCTLTFLNYRLTMLHHRMQGVSLFHMRFIVAANTHIKETRGQIGVIRVLVIVFHAIARIS